jgi:hypothetical protein
MFRSVWRIESSNVLAEIALAVTAAILGSIGIYFSPIFATLLGLAFVVLIYRLRYKRL